MDHVKKSDIPYQKKEGRELFGVFGAEQYIRTDDASMMYCHAESSMGKIPAHVHGTEVIYIVNAESALFLSGPDKEHLEKYELSVDDVLYVQEVDWHCFDFTNENGFVDSIAFFPTSEPEITE